MCFGLHCFVIGLSTPFLTSFSGDWDFWLLAQDSNPTSLFPLPEKQTLLFISGPQTLTSSSHCFSNFIPDDSVVLSSKRSRNAEQMGRRERRRWQQADPVSGPLSSGSSGVVSCAEGKWPSRGWPCGLSGCSVPVTPTSAGARRLPLICLAIGPLHPWFPCALEESSYFTLRKGVLTVKRNMKSKKQLLNSQPVVNLYIFSNSKNHIVTTFFQKVIYPPLPPQLSFSQN